MTEPNMLPEKTEFINFITMDDENIEKFKKLYGEGEQHLICEILVDTKISFSMIVPEPAKDESDGSWTNKTKQDVWFWRDMGFSDEDFEAPEDLPPEIGWHPPTYRKSEMIGDALEKWRMENWGTPSDLLYDSLEGPDIRSLEGLLKGEYGFYTFGKPPFKVYEKMAADGLVFEIRWWSDYAYDEWFTGKGQVEKGRFQYHAGPMTGYENHQMQSVARDFFDCSKEGPNNQRTIVVKNREHLDQLLKELQRYIKTNLYMQGEISLIDSIAENTITLSNVLDLNFFDVSNVTDFSNLFANFDVSPCPEKGWFCKIKLDISKWNISNVSKKALLLDNDRVDLGDLSK